MSISDLRRIQTPQPEPCRRLLDLGFVSNMFRAHLFKLLLACRPEGCQSLGPLELGFPSISVGLEAEIPSAGLLDVRTVNLGNRGPANDRLTEFDEDTRHASTNQRRHAHLAIGVWLNSPWDAQ